MRTTRELPALGLLAVVGLLFLDAVLGRGVFFQRDIHWVWLPRIESVVRGVAGGAWPLWDPSSTFGLPVLADPSYQVAYPFTWLNLALKPATYYTVFVLAHTLWAGLGLYFLARAWGLQRLAAFVGGAAWASSGPLLSTVSLYHHFAGAAWMPWVLLALERTLSRGGLSSALALGAAAAAELLAGSGDMCLMTGVLGSARILWRVLSEASGARLRAAAGLARSCLVAGLFGMALTAVQWLPTAALLREGSRLDMPPRVSMFWSLHPACLLDVLVPGLVTDLRMNDTLRAELFESREPFLASVYLGCSVLFLALLGVLIERRLALPTALAALAFVVFALGRHTPVYPLLLHLPPFAILRYPVKYMVPVALLVALLAALGAQAWLRPWSRVETRAASVVAAVALCLGVAALTGAQWLLHRPGALLNILEPGASVETPVLSLRSIALLAFLIAGMFGLRRLWSGAPRWLTAALVLLCLGDVVVAGQRVNRLAPPALLAYRPPWLATLRREPWPARIYVAPYPYSSQYARLLPRAGWAFDWAWTIGLQDLLAPPIGERWGFSGSYDGDFTGLTPRALSATSAMLVRAWRTPLALRLLQMGSVDHVVSLREEAWLGTEPQIVSSVFSSPIRIYPVPDPLPRSYAVAAARIASGPAPDASIPEGGFDPRHEVILEAGGGSPRRPGFHGTSHLLRRQADALSLEADLSEPGFVVVVEAHQAGWRATVDGNPTEILRANTLLRAVRVPAGRHVVEMRYRPPEAAAGALLSCLGAAVGIAYWARRLVRPRNAGASV